MIKSDDFGDIRPQFCFVRPRWCRSRTYVLSGEKNYLQPCEVYFELYSPVPLPLDALNGWLNINSFELRKNV